MIHKFNDFPFNMMSWLNSTTIEAHFNVGNPRKGDIIQYGAKQYKIEQIDYFHGIDVLIVKEKKQ